MVFLCLQYGAAVRPIAGKPAPTPTASLQAMHYPVGAGLPAMRPAQKTQDVASNPTAWAVASALPENAAQQPGETPLKLIAA